MLDDDMLRSPPMLGDPHYATYNTRDAEPPSDPCGAHDDPDDAHSCNTCETDPCECGYGGVMETKLTCSKCSGVLFLEGGCGCHSGTDVHVPDVDIDYTSHDQPHHEKPIAYMAKSQLHKLAKYAQKLQHMIPDDHDLDDWMRSHISQAADDIGEVYHKLDYQNATHGDDR